MFTANHRQHLLVAFKSLDESLDEIVRCLVPAPEERVFSLYRDRPGAALAERVERLVADVRGELNAFIAAQDLTPPAPTLSRQQSAHARAALALVAVMELDATHLEGYGSLSAEERDTLDALSDRLRTEVAQLIAALADSGDDAAPSQAGPR